MLQLELHQNLMLQSVLAAFEHVLCCKVLLYEVQYMWLHHDTDESPVASGTNMIVMKKPRRPAQHTIQNLVVLPT